MVIVFLDFFLKAHFPSHCRGLYSHWKCLFSFIKHFAEIWNWALLTIKCFLQQVVKEWLIWPIRVTYVWTIPEVFLTNNTIMPWVFFSPKCYSLNMQEFTNCLIMQYNCSEMANCPQNWWKAKPELLLSSHVLMWWEAGVPPSIFQTVRQMTVLLARWVSFYILKLGIPHNEGF